MSRRAVRIAASTASDVAYSAQTSAAVPGASTSDPSSTPVIAAEAGERERPIAVDERWRASAQPRKLGRARSPRRRLFAEERAELDAERGGEAR